MKKLNSGFINEENMCLFKDYYEDTMGKADLDHENDAIITENYFFRKIPKNLGNYLISAGLEQVMHFVKNIRFSDNMLKWLRQTSGRDFSDEFVDYLRDFEFKGDIYAVPEGTPVFPNEPIINVTGPSIDVQLFETYLLNVTNFQTLVATKAARIRHAAGKDKTCLDFGSRRAHGRDAAVLGARASYIGGMDGTSLELAGYLFGIPYTGTMAHKFIQDRQREGEKFQESELRAFRDYAESFPHNTILLIDTYDTIEGAKNACKIGKELEEKGYRLKGVRLDSGDLSGLSKKVRKILNDESLDYVKIFASSDLDEFKIEKLLEKNAPIDGFGIGTRLITGANYNPFTKEGGVSALGGVYKHAERTENNKVIPTSKTSDKKGTLPGRKQVYRIYENKKYSKDVIALWDEEIEDGEPLLVPIIKTGEIVYDFPGLSDIRERTLEELEKLPEDYKKLTGGEKYPVEKTLKLQKLEEKLVKRNEEVDEVK